MIGTVVQLAALLLLLAGGGLSTRSALRAFNAYREGRGKPLLVHATPENLADLQAAWPFREARWPRPVAADPEPMHRTEAAAYARLAFRSQRRSVIAGQALAVIGGAWLGVSLPSTWRLMTDPNGIDVASPAFWQLLGVMVLIEIALLIGDQANDYEAVRTVYRRHALRTDDDSPAPIPTRASFARKVWDWVRSGG